MPPIGASDEGSDDRLPAALADLVVAREDRFRRAHAVAAEVVTLPPAERRTFVAAHADCQCPEFVELMIAMARERRGEEPRDSVRCAHLAVTAAEAYIAAGGRHGDDVRALAWAELGNSHRICGDLRSAGTAFHYARERVRYAADPLVRAEVYSLEASYRDYRREFVQADRLLRRAEWLERRFGSSGARGKILIQRAEILRRTERPVAAIDLLISALRLISPRESPALVLTGIHNLAYCLILSGALDRALAMLRRFRPAYEAFADPRFQTRRAWLEAKAIRGSGLCDLGTSMLEDVQARFAALNCPYEVALLHLDLVEAYAEAGSWERVERSAAHTVELCRAYGVGTEGIAAAHLLQRAAARRQATVELIASMAETVRKHLAPHAGL